MRPALVDNLTLEAVERLLGQIVAYYYEDGEEMIQEDIVAFDNLINTILFSDEIVYIDCFKAEDEKRNPKYPYFPRFKQYRLGLIPFKNLIKEVNDKFVSKYAPELKEHPSFCQYQWMKPNIQLPAINKVEYGTLVYHTISANLGTDLVLFPTRATFQRKLMRDLAKEKGENAEEMPVETKDPSPLFIAWFAKNVKDPKKFIDAAYELRDEGVFKDVRNDLDELKALYEAKPGCYAVKVKKLRKAINGKMEQITLEYKISSEEGTLRRPILKMSNLIHINQKFSPIVSLEFPQTQCLYPGPRKEHAVLLSQDATDKEEVEKLGVLYDYITSDLVRQGTLKEKKFLDEINQEEVKGCQEKARALFEKYIPDPKVDVEELINRSDMIICEETIKALRAKIDK